MLDEIAAVNELKFQIAISIRVGETLVDGNGRLRRAAFEACERYLRRRVPGPAKLSSTPAQATPTSIVSIRFTVFLYR